MPPTSLSSITALVPTLNEADNIQSCLERIQWVRRIIVIDSGSTDGTQDLAVSLGAEVHFREFDNHAAQKNWAIDELNIETDWILFVDADEHVDDDLKYEIKNAISLDDDFSGYYVPRQNYFMGKKLRHCGMYPDWQLRLFKKGCARYEMRIVHEHMCVDGKIGFLHNPLDHFDKKGIERYIDRHNKYSTLEAIEAYRHLNGKIQDYGKNLPNKRRLLKNMSYKYLPFRPAFVFLWMYIFKRGFLDGWAGLQYCVLRSVYEHQIDLKLVELKNPDSPMATHLAEHYPGKL